MPIIVHLYLNRAHSESEKSNTWLESVETFETFREFQVFTRKWVWISAFAYARESFTWILFVSADICA